MSKESLIEIIDTVSKLSSQQYKMVIPCAKFESHLRKNLGSTIDLSTMGEFAIFIGELETTDLRVMSSCSEFIFYLKENLGGPINLSTMGAFSSFISKLLDTIE